MRLSVDPRSGRVKLTLPPRASLKKGMDWAEEQQGWIAVQQAKLPEARPFEPGTRFPLGDAEIEIVWPGTGAGRTPASWRPAARAAARARGWSGASSAGCAEARSTC
jgi:predicted metal-dependent hydrolase